MIIKSEDIDKCPSDAENINNLVEIWEELNPGVATIWTILTVREIEVLMQGAKYYCSSYKESICSIYRAWNMLKLHQKQQLGLLKRALVSSSSKNAWDDEIIYVLNKIGKEL
jgi:hypothetical protein